MFTLTTEIWKELYEIVRDDNWEVQYVPDRTQHGVAELWTFALNNKGDCEDKALSKYEKVVRRLSEVIPRDAIRMTTAWCHPGREGYHAFLTIITNQGDYALDNRFNKPMSCVDLEDKHGYEFHMRERAPSEGGDPRIWEEVKPYTEAA